MTAAEPANIPNPAGWHIKPWSSACGWSDQLTYKLWRQNCGPRFIKVGTRTVIVEQPEAFLARLATESPPPARPAKPPPPAKPGPAAKPAPKPRRAPTARSSPSKRVRARA